MNNFSIYKDKVNIDGKEFTIGRNAIVFVKQYNIDINILNNFIEYLETDLNFNDISYRIFEENIPPILLNCLISLSTHLNFKKMEQYINKKANECFKTNSINHRILKKFLTIDSKQMLTALVSGKRNYSYLFKELIQDVCENYRKTLSSNFELKISSVVINNNEYFMAFSVINDFKKANLTYDKLMNFINMLNGNNFLKPNEIIKIIFDDEQNKYISSTSLLHLVTLINSDIIHNYLDLSAQKCFSLNKPSALALKKYLNLQQTIYVNKNEKNNKSYTYYLNQIITSICEKYKILKLEEKISNRKPLNNTIYKKEKQDFYIYKTSLQIYNSRLFIKKDKILLLKEIDFNMEKFQYYDQLIEEGSLKINEITKKVLNNNCNDKIITLLAIIYSNIFVKKFNKYLFKQSIKCFKNKCIYHQNLKKYLGLNDTEILKKNISYNNNNFKQIFLEKIENTCLFFKNNNLIKNKVYKVCANKYIIYYHGKELTINIPMTSNCKENNRIFSEEPKLIFHILEYISKNYSLSESTKNIHIGLSIINKLIINYYPKYFNNIIKKEMKSKIINNQQINLSIRGNNSFIKVSKMYSSMFERTYEIVLNTMRKVQKRIFSQINLKFLNDRSKNNFSIGFIYKGAFYTYNFDVKFKNKPLYLEYCTYFFHNELKKHNIVKLKKLSIILNELTLKNSTISSSRDITLDMILVYLRENNELLTRTKLSPFFDFLISFNKINNLTNLPNPPEVNICNKITNKKEKSNNAKVIPENVYTRIHDNITYLPENIKNAFLICTATGCRIGELEFMYEDSLKYSKEEQSYILKFFISKTQKSSFKRGKDSFRKVPINDLDVVNAYKKQIQLSETLRNKSNLKSIFLYETKNKNIKIIDEFIYSKKINNIIMKFNIKDENNNIWHFTSHQIRATITTKLAETGYTSAEIMEFMGWVDSHTLENAYINLEKHRLTDLNSKFFNDNFKAEISEDVLKSFTYEDKRKLFISLYINFRQMEYGKCVRHPILGECGKLQEPKSCASCNKLITSKDFLPKWEKLKNSQLNIIDQLEIKFKEENIKKEDYENWAEYKREIFILNSYNNLIERLK